MNVRRGAISWVLHSESDLSALETLLANPEKIFRPDTLVRDGTMVTIARVPSPLRSVESCLLRRTNYGKPRARLRDCFRPAAPIRAFRNALALEVAGIATPRVIAAGVIRTWRVPLKGYLLVEEIQSAQSIGDYVTVHRGLPHAAIERVADVIANLHKSGFIHGDLTIGNILLDQRLHPWFVDLERMGSYGSPVEWRQATEDFFRLARHVKKLGPGATFGALRLIKRYCAQRGWAKRERQLSTDIFDLLRRKVRDA
jgi:tRNA A-37 threonylcarbamoyl transferase component Bud32